MAQVPPRACEEQVPVTGNSGGVRAGAGAALAYHRAYHRECLAAAGRAQSSEVTGLSLLKQHKNSPSTAAFADVVRLSRSLQGEVSLGLVSEHCPFWQGQVLGEMPIPSVRLHPQGANANASVKYSQ